MASNFTPQQIKELIEESKSAEHYPKSVFHELDGEMLDERRLLATKAQRILDRYFKKHPEDSIENYL